RGVHRVEHRHALDVLAGLARRDAGDELRPVALVVEPMEGPLAPGQPGDDEPRVLVDEDAHAASSTTFAAAPSIVFSTWTFGRFASVSSRRPSTSLVPSSRTMNGTFTSSFPNASISPRATS